jgi:antitoxin (DNA-binding transcriptional repressor) of toxin-antitoxin stability system
MKFISIRDLRRKTSEIKKSLARNDLVLTSNGRPFALVSRVSEESLEEELKALQQARAKVALDRLREEARERGLSGVSMEKVDQIIAEVRKGRRA